MKTRTLLLIASAVSFAASCAKVEPVVTNNSGESTFTANVEQQFTKTELNSGATGLLWKAGDKVRIYGSTANAEYTAQAAGSYTILSGDPVGSAPFAAYYPSDKCTGWTPGTKTFAVEFPATQTYVANNIADGAYPMIGYITSGTGFSFKNVGGLVCVKVKGAYDNIKVQSIMISAPVAISGAANVEWTGDSNDPVDVQMTGTDPEDCTVTLDCSAANVILSSTEFKSFYIVVPAEDYSSLQVTVTGSVLNETYTASQTLTSKANVEVVRSAKTDFKIAATKIIFDLSQQKGHLNETANCYLIKTPGMYKFPVTVKGNGVDTTGSTASGILPASIKSSGVYYTDGTNPVDSIKVVDGFAVFATPKTITAGGNALFGIFNTAEGTPETNVKGNCIWSWDIWANPTVQDVSTTGNVSGKDTTITFLSCHLGACQNGFVGNDGYFYQWGRKDPFPQAGSLSGVFVQASDGGAATFETAVNNPTHWYRSTTNQGSSGNYEQDWCDISSAKLWDYDNNNHSNDDVDKTMYDPCPVGYHVPSFFAIKKICNADKTKFSSETCYYYGFTGSKTICWPSCGFRDRANGNLNSRGSGTDGSFHGWSAYSEPTIQYAGELYGSGTYEVFGKYMGFPVRPQKD